MIIYPLELATWLFDKGVEKMSAYQFLGNLTKVTVKENGLLLTCGQHLVKVTLLAPEICRIVLAKNGVWETNLEYALAGNNWPGAKFKVTENDDSMTVATEKLVIEIQRKPCRFTFQTPDGMVLNKDESAFGMGWDESEVAVFKSLLPGERFLGLGEKGGPLERRNREFVMWNSDQLEYRDRTDPLYQSHPFYIGLVGGKAYGIFWNNSYRSTFNMGAGNHRLMYFSAEKGPLDYFFFYGPSIKEVISRYSKLVGRSPLPPKWVLGFHQSRWSYYPENEVRAVVNTFREKKIPLDAIYLDIHYMKGFRCFTFDEQRFPNPRKLMADLKAQGVKVVTIVDPGVKVDPGYWVYDSGVVGDHFVKFPDGQRFTADVWPGCCHFANFTRPETRTWWGDLYRELMEVGVAGFWNDMNEPAVWGFGLPPLVEFDENGQKVTLKKIRNVFGHLMAQATYEGLRRLMPDERPFILTRAGFAGTQRYAASWTGDNVAAFEHLELAIRLCLSMGLSGIPVVGADVGGFSNRGEACGELFVRWMQVGAFTPFFRAHTSLHSPRQEPWSYGEAVEDLVRQAIEWRYRLLPYTYGVFRQAEALGWPIMRSLFFECQDDPETFNPHNDTTYFWGDHLLIAPVTQQGQTIRKVYLPRGVWYDFRENRRYEGGQYHLVEAPLDQIPVFVRAGATIPLQSIQQYVDEFPLEELELHVFPGGQQTSELYEDDGHSFQYRSGQFHARELTTAIEANKFILHIHAPTGQYQPPRRRFKIVLRGQARRPGTISVDEKALPAEAIEFDRTNGNVTIFLEDDRHPHQVVWGR